MKESPSCRGHTAHPLDSMNTSVSAENLIPCQHCDRSSACDCRDRVGVFLPRNSSRQTWRIFRWYARELRNMGMADFINHAKDVRLTFTPDLMKMMGGACMPDFAVGLNHRKLANGVTLSRPKRTKTRCVRPLSYSLRQCQEVNGTVLNAGLSGA